MYLIILPYMLSHINVSLMITTTIAKQGPPLALDDAKTIFDVYERRSNECTPCHATLCRFCERFPAEMESCMCMCVWREVVEYIHSFMWIEHGTSFSSPALALFRRNLFLIMKSGVSDSAVCCPSEGSAPSGKFLLFLLPENVKAEKSGKRNASSVRKKGLENLIFFLLGTSVSWVKLLRFKGYWNKVGTASHVFNI